MSDYDTIAGRYIDAWNVTEETERRKAVVDLYSEDARYVDPLAAAQGHDEISGLIGAVQIAQLRAGSGGDIGIHGSITLAQSLLGAGLVDELRLVVAPAAAHTGRHLFSDEQAPTRRFTLVDVRRSATGCLLTHCAARGA